MYLKKNIVPGKTKIVFSILFIFQLLGFNVYSDADQKNEKFAW